MWKTNVQNMVVGGRAQRRRPHLTRYFTRRAHAPKRQEHHQHRAPGVAEAAASNGAVRQARTAPHHLAASDAELYVTTRSFDSTPRIPCIAATIESQNERKSETDDEPHGARSTYRSDRVARKAEQAHGYRVRRTPLLRVADGGTTGSAGTHGSGAPSTLGGRNAGGGSHDIAHPRRIGASLCGYGTPHRGRVHSAHSWVKRVNPPNCCTAVDAASEARRPRSRADSSRIRPVTRPATKASPAPVRSTTGASPNGKN